jgi:hypothetical protein
MARTPNEWKMWREGFYTGIIAMTIFILVVTQIAR